MTHPAERYVSSMTELSKRATLASGALGLSIGVNVYDFFARLWTLTLFGSLTHADPDEPTLNVVHRFNRAGQFVDIGGYVGIAMLALTAILFLRWVHRFVVLARGLGARDLSWSPAQAVATFVLPIVSFFRPHLVLTELEEQTDPENIAEPPPRVERDAVAGYRGTTFVATPVAKRVRRALIGFWWGTWIASNLLSLFAWLFARGLHESYYVLMGADFLGVIAAVLAIHVVRTLTARMEERFRRILYTEPDALAAQVELR